MSLELNQVDRDPAAWAPCESGVLTCLQQRLCRTKGQCAKVWAAGGAAVTAAVLAVLLWPAAIAGGITCTECVEQMPAYQRSLVGVEEMPADEAAAVRAHLDSCPKCREHFERAYRDSSPPLEAVGLAERLRLFRFL